MGSDLITLDYVTADGWIEIARHSPHSHVASIRLHVYSDRRGRGIGRHLIYVAQEKALHHGIRRLEATPYVGNPGSTEFFRRLEGWEHEGVRRKGGRAAGELVDTHLFAWVVEG